MEDKKLYALLGRRLGHSWSARIHRELYCPGYRHVEREPEELERFFAETDIGGLNVTIPYKKEVLRFCRHISPAVEAVGSANTLVPHPDGGLAAYNTDVDGFIYMARRAGIEPAGKKVVVFGRGGAWLAVRYACETLGAREVVSVSRTGEDNYENLSRHYDAEVVVNATPVGMYPDMDGQAADISGFSRLEGALDLIYNPRRTNFLLQAASMCAKCADGFTMLVAQAARSEERFFSREIPAAETERVLASFAPGTRNIVLIGMPGSGKSTIGALLSELSGFPCVDTDEEIVRRAGRSIPELFAESGEARFREYEREVIADAARKTGQVIITGGGAVKTRENLAPLRRTGRVYHLEREASLLPRGGRPLSQGADLDAMYRERLPLYVAFRDRVIENSSTPRAAAEAIWRDHVENSCN